MMPAGGGLFGAGSLGSTDPPMTTPGMTMLKLDLGGRLIEFRRALPDRAAARPAAVNWTPLFDLAGLDRAAFREVPSEWLGHTAADTRAAWIGRGADGQDAELRVEAAALNGRVVFFRLIAPWTRGQEELQPVPGSARIVSWALIGLFVVTLLAAATLAIRQLRLGRADTRGATRVAVASAVTAVVSTLLDQHFAAAPLLVVSLLQGLSAAAFLALMAWTFYIAIEPPIRRRWPRGLIAWNRLLEGRWRDPLVGRELLIGGALAAAWNLLNALEPAAKAAHGAPPALPFLNPRTLSGTMEAIGGVVFAVPFSVTMALGTLLLLVLLRILLRSERAAAIALFVLLAATDATAMDDPVVQLPLWLLINALIVVAATRFGLVALVTVSFCSHFVVYGNMTLTPPPHLVGTMLVLTIGLIGPGVFGWFTSRPRRAGGRSWLDA
jgi:serine/threonine-protein kinase